MLFICASVGGPVQILRGQVEGGDIMSTIEQGPRHVAPKGRSRVGRNLMSTLPFVLVGSMTMAFNMTAPIDPVEAKPRTDKAEPTPTDLEATVHAAFAAVAANAVTPAEDDTADTATTTAATPTSYTVQGGDSVSSIAGRYGLATASVLALNGISWKSVIHPGQVLKLTAGSTPVAAPQAPVTGNRYTIQSGDTMGRIAAKFGVSTQTLLSANGLSATSIIYPGRTIAIPGAAAIPAAPAQATPAAGSSYVVQSGDTVSRIASKFGVTAQALLDANGLGWSSIIYAGKSLKLPGGAATTALAVTPVVSVTPAPSTGSGISGLTSEMAANARTILRVGRSLGVPQYGLVIALATAMQESGLRNLPYGDRDSLGLFQQRPSAGWGKAAQLLDTEHAAKLFFGGAKNPNKGNTKGLLDIPGWQNRSVTDAAQAVQRSAYPLAYAKWESSARSWVAAL